MLHWSVEVWLAIDDAQRAVDRQAACGLSALNGWLGVIGLTLRRRRVDRWPELEATVRRAHERYVVTFRIRDDREA